MATRVSARVILNVNECEDPLTASISEPLIEWVMENLIKNAVDAMDGVGTITVTTSRIASGKHKPETARIDVTDTGKGLPRRDFSAIFRPGYTTKSRGWGLGLTLAKRIVEQYHGGRIFVADSTPGIGTTFTILLPLT